MRVIAGLAVAAVAVLAWGGWGILVEPAVTQPIEFPHKAHLELKDKKVECTTCHDRAEKGAAAGRPSTKKCLSCHTGEGKTAEEKKLHAFGEKGGEIPWRRVWRLPSHVYFPHQTHVVTAKVKCQTCHGPMETLVRPPARALKKIAMSDCIGCHETWEWPKEEKDKAADPVQAASARRISTDCNACHR